MSDSRSPQGEGESRRGTDGPKVPNKPITPGIQAVPPHHVQHRRVPRSTLFDRHGEALRQCAGDPGLVVRIDDQRRGQLARRAGKLRQHQHAGIVRVLCRDVFLGHKVHPVAQRRHQPDPRFRVERHQCIAREAAVEVAQGHPVEIGEAAVDSSGLGLQLAADLSIGLDVGTRWRCDLHEHHVAVVLWRILQKSLERKEALAQTLRVVQSVHAQDQLPPVQMIA